METAGYDYKDPKNSNNLNFEEMLRGYYAEMKDPKNADKTEDELKEMVAKNLTGDPTYYTTNQAFGIMDIGYTEDAPGLGSPKEIKGEYKGSGYGESTNKDIPEGEIIAADAPNIYKPAIGETYGRIESPKGELGFYLVADGTTKPYRFKVRPPSFVNLTALRHMCIGHKVADAVIILGSIDIVLGEVDR